MPRHPNCYPDDGPDGSLIPPNAGPDDYASVLAIARRYGVTRAAVYDALRRGRLRRCYRITREIVVDCRDAEEYFRREKDSSAGSLDNV